MHEHPHPHPHKHARDREPEHPHHHEKGHGHSHDYKSLERRQLIIALSVNAVVMVVEVIGGILTNSLALLSDAGHMFTHLFALFTSYFAIVLASRNFNDRKTFGYFRAEILAAFVNSLFLLIMVAAIVWEAVKVVRHPREILAGEMIVIACVGLATNLVSYFLLKPAAQHDVNIRSAFLHVLTDLLSSLLIIVGGIAIYFTGITFIDPILSVVIALFIVVWAWRLLRESVDILLEAAPKGLDTSKIAGAIRDAYPEIRGVHDIHVWVITTHMHAATLHVYLDDALLSRTVQLSRGIQSLLRDRFHIGHVNVQFESDCADCHTHGTP